MGLPDAYQQAALASLKTGLPDAYLQALLGRSGPHHVGREATTAEVVCVRKSSFYNLVKECLKKSSTDGCAGCSSLTIFR